MSSEPQFGLSPREREIVSAVVAGYTNGEIAEQFEISQNTVKHHLCNIFDKLGVYTRLEVALLALQWLGGPDTTGIAVTKPRSPNLSSGSAAASLDH